jgi:hypothetical protein
MFFTRLKLQRKWVPFFCRHCQTFANIWFLNNKKAPKRFKKKRRVVQNWRFTNESGYFVLFLFIKAHRIWSTTMFFFLFHVLHFHHYSRLVVHVLHYLCCWKRADCSEIKNKNDDDNRRNKLEKKYFFPKKREGGNKCGWGFCSQEGTQTRTRIRHED